MAFREGRGSAVQRDRKTQQIIDALEGEAGLHGFELVDVELAGSARRPLLRIWLDKEGLTLDDIAAASGWINACLEAADPIRGSYTLEVSSPGVDRRLRTQAHFERFVGQTVIITSLPVNGRSKWTGTLVGVVGSDEDSKIILKLESTKATTESTVELAFAQIRKAQLKGQVKAK
jgi:ribosome maturation factor RimP